MKKTIAAGLALVALTACRASATDPRVDKVWIKHTNIYKICDGTTLIYSKGGHVLNSPQCAQ